MINFGGGVFTLKKGLIGLIFSLIIAPLVLLNFVIFCASSHFEEVLIVEVVFEGFLMLLEAETVLLV